MTELKPGFVMTPKLRVSFPDVFVARAMEEGAEADFGLTMLFASGANLAPLYEAAKWAAQAKWGNKIPPKLKTPFKNAEEGCDREGNRYDGYEDDGMIFVRARSKRKPDIRDESGTRRLTDAGGFYAGCYARALIHAYAWSHKTGGCGVSFGLDHLQRWGHGEQFSGGVANADDLFDSVEDDAFPTDAPAPEASIFG